jgi:hypothetical protein
MALQPVGPAALPLWQDRVGRRRTSDRSRLFRPRCGSWRRQAHEALLRRQQKPPASFHALGAFQIHDVVTSVTVDYFGSQRRAHINTLDINLNERCGP